MALAYAIVPFQIPNGPSPQTLVLNFVDAITGLPFTPSGWLYVGNRTDSGSFPAWYDWRIGLGSIPGRQIGFSCGGGLFLTGNNVQDYWSTSSCITAVRNIATNQYHHSGYLSVVGNGTVTVTFDYNAIGSQSRGDRSAFLFLGGTGVSGYSDYYQGSGAVSITTPGFRPTGVIGYKNPGVPSVGVVGIGGMPGLGCASDDCGSAAMVGIPTGSTPPNGYSAQLADQFALSITGGGVLDQLPTITMTATGFDVSEGPATLFCPYLAFNGCAVNVVRFNQQAAAGVQSVPITMGTPRVVIVFSINKPTGAGSQADCFNMVGIADLATQVVFWTGFAQSSSPYLCDARYAGDRGIAAYTPTGAAASTLNASAQLSGLRSQFVDWSWLTSDGVAREYVMMILGDDLGTGPCGEPTPPPNPCIPDAPEVPAISTAAATWNPSSVSGAPGRII